MITPEVGKKYYVRDHQGCVEKGRCVALSVSERGAAIFKTLMLGDVLIPASNIIAEVATKPSLLSRIFRASESQK